MTTLPNWPATKALAFSIIKVRTCTREKTKIVNGSVVTTKRTSPFRLMHLADELGVHRGQLHGWMRAGVVPSEPNQKKVAKWCEKHRKHLK